MGGLYGILIWTSLLVLLDGQVLFDDMGDRQRSEDLTIHLIRTELKQFRQGIEKMVMKKLEEVKNISDTKCNESLSTIQTEQRLLRQEMVSIATKVDTLLNKSETNLMKSDKAGSDCSDTLEYNPITQGKNGVYNITASSYILKTVYCDMTTDNGGWTVIQRRLNGSVDFYRNWTDYKNGFGFADHEYWIGNDMLHRLTSMNPQELRVDMERFNGEKAYAVYSNFSVGDEASKYQLQVTGYSGNGGDSLYVNNNMKFSTQDQDNDQDNGPDWSGGNCATRYRTGWWFNYCTYTNPNGQYADSEKNGSITWYYWKYSWISLKSIQLMIRPRA